MDEQGNEQAAVSGASQITVNRKWVAIIVATIMAFVLCVGWMYQVVATARPVSAQYLKEHPRQ